MSKAKHTPLPWRASKHRLRDTEGIVISATGADGNWQPVAVASYLGCERPDGYKPFRPNPATRRLIAEQKANAELIVRVVNAHEALLAACKMVLRRWTFNNDQHHTHSWHDMADCAEVIRAAIASAESGETA